MNSYIIPPSIQDYMDKPTKPVESYNWNRTAVAEGMRAFIGGGAYWAGRAAARPLFSPCRQSLFFARPLFVVENLYFV